MAANTLSEFSHRMLLSSYDAKVQLEVIQAAVVGYERKVAKTTNQRREEVDVPPSRHC